MRRLQLFLMICDCSRRRQLITSQELRRLVTRGGRGFKGEDKKLKPLEHAPEAVDWVTSVQYPRARDWLSVLR